tara:strand:- start:2130 stop:2366 length:237 start_codon:yes stop_codon:yes gene_type:complete
VIYDMNEILTIENKSSSTQYTINIYRNIIEFVLYVEPTKKNETILLLENTDINKIKNAIQNLESMDKKIVNVINEIVK